MFNGRRQPYRGGTSRMTRECQVRICERLGVQFPGPTRQFPGPTRPEEQSQNRPRLRLDDDRRSGLGALHERARKKAKLG